jgi:hypothetical protein
MKKKILCVLFGCVALSGLGQAQNFSGIYKDPTQSNSYLSIHQNGSKVITTSYNTVPIPAGDIYYSSAAGIYYPSRADVWDLYSGTVAGSSGFLSGEFNYGACFGRASMRLNADSSISFTVTSISTTASGIAQGVQCGRFGTGTVNMPKVF